MDNDDATIANDRQNEKLWRIEKLGFKPQKEIFCNKYLPYADKLDDESQLMLNEIIEKLGKCLAIRDIYGILLITNHLNDYMRMYGMKFSKELHKKFLEIYFELISLKDLGFHELNTFCSMAATLLKKDNYFSPEDLEVDWKPLNELAKKILYKSETKGEFYRHTCPVDSNLSLLIQHCSLYFPKSATIEILDEFFPKLEIRESEKYSVPFEMLSLFLNPVHGYELWLDDFLSLWINFHNAPFSSDLMCIISKTAKFNIGYIDWEPHIPTIFARIMRSIDLPVTYKGITSAKKPTLWSSSVALWIVSTLGPNSSTQKYLNQFMSVIESYLHPANLGKWVSTIGVILVHLTKCLENRLKLERYKSHNWLTPIPDSHKLTENCLTAFVECMKPIALQAMYSRMSSYDVAKIFKTLADIRPHLIIEDVITRVTTTLDSVTEPHKMTAALQCLISVSRAMVSGHQGYTAGRTEAIPILFSTLPGIDPNDFKKTTITLQFLTSFALLVPIIDCSKAGSVRDDLTEEEHIICEHTADLENYVLLFMDKIFQLIDATSVEPIRMEQSQSDQSRSKLEALAEAWITSSGHAILGQCSDDILLSASNKLIKFIQTNLFEPKVAGLLVSALIRIFARVAGPMTLPTLIPYVIEKLEYLLNERENMNTLEKQSDEFLYYLTLLIGISRGNPLELIKETHRNPILAIIDRILFFKCKSTNRIINDILLYYISNLSTIQTLDVRSLPESYHKSLNEFLPIRHWGEKMKNNDKIDWYFPDENARKICETLVHRYIPKVLDNLTKFINTEINLEKEELHNNLTVISSILKCSNFLPNWEQDNVLRLVDTDLLFYRPKITNGFDDLIITMPDGENVRYAIFKVITKLQEKMLETHEDDITSFKSIIAIWDKIHWQRNNNRNVFENQLKNLQNTKKFQDYNLTRYKRDLRTVVITRVLIQHDLREECNQPLFTKNHEQLMLNLVRLSTSRYSVIRGISQSILFNIISSYPYSYRCILEKLTDNLKLDSNEHHDLFKGTLFVMAGVRREKLFIKNDWNVLKSLWIGLLNTNLSEKPSIVALIDYLSETMDNELTTISIKIEIPDKLVEAGLNIINKINQRPSSKEIEDGRLKLIEFSKTNKSIYEDILKSILEITSRPGIHWRYHLIGSSMIYNLDNPQTKYNRPLTKYVLENLIHDSIDERKDALQILNFILKHEKRIHPKILVDPFKVAGVEKPNTKLPIGIRPDNKFLQYDEKNFPRNQSDWDEPRYAVKANGFFGWPQKYYVYAPSSEQPNINRKFEELNEVEQEIYKFFTNTSSIDKLIHFWSLEEKKGKDKFNRSRYIMIRNLFSAFGDSFLDIFLPHLNNLINKNNNESHHRCAAEILAGIIRGTKHWNYEKTEMLYNKIVPLIRKILVSITVESESYWGTCFATASEHMDPNRQYWLHETLLEPFFSDQLTSYISCSRIYCFQGTFAQHIWRMNSVGYRVLNYIKPYISHSFQNVRERIASLLINIFDADITYPGGYDLESPKIKDLMIEIIPKLRVLYGEPPKKNSLNSNELNESELEESKNYDEAIRIFKTVARFMTGYLNRTCNVNREEFFEFLPLACRLDRSEIDAELVEVSTSLLAMMSLALTYPNTMECALNKINEVSEMQSWSARLSILDFLQAIIFHNMAVVISREDWVNKVKEIVLKLLGDTVLEIREKAAQVLGGLIHCSFLPATDELLEQFKKKCRTKIIKSGGRSGLKVASTSNSAVSADGSCASETREACSIRERHIGVLGLCAFISAYPYDIPDIVPKAFEQLGAHLNDPQPIPATIRKTVGNFKRTHQDNWATLQLKLTETQLAVLTDVDVPPSYYA